MKKFLTLVLFIGFLTGCGCNKSAEIGPADIVRAFYEAVTTGDFAQAEGFCNADCAEQYLEPLRKEWGTCDSTVTTILPDILKEIRINILNVEKIGGDRIIAYTLTNSESNSKDKTAVLRKEEGVWKIVSIIDRK